VSKNGRMRFARLGVAVAGAVTALTFGLWVQSTAAQPSAPAQRIASVPAAAGAAAGGGSGRVNVIARDYSFDAPATVSTGIVTVVMQNQGDEPHHAQLVRLNEGVTMEQFGGALMRGPEAAFPLVSFEGGPGVADPGGTSQATMNLTAGQYMMLCFVETDEGVPHLALGMIRPFQVAPPPSPAQAPRADATVTLRDFSFETPPITAGERTLRVVNEGPQIHEMAVIRASAALPEVIAALMNMDEEPSFPIESYGGLQAIDAGKSGWVTLDFTPGTYVFICFVPDPETGLPHAALGMVDAFVVE
jgi:hypothetical protein